MPCPLFGPIFAAIDRCDIFQLCKDDTGKPRISSLQRIGTSLRMLAYGVASEAIGGSASTSFLSAV